MTNANAGQSGRWTGFLTALALFLLLVLGLWLFNACTSAFNDSDEKPATGNTRVVKYSENQCFNLRFDMLNDANSAKTKHNAAIEYEKHC